MDGWRDGKKLLLKWNKHDLSQNNMCIYIEINRYERVCIRISNMYTTTDCRYNMCIYINLWCYTQRCTSSDRCQWEQLHVSPTAQHPIPGVGDAGHPESWEGYCFLVEIQSSHPVEETNMTMETIWTCTCYRKVVMFQFAIVGPISFSASFCWSHETMQNRWAKIS